MLSFKSARGIVFQCLKFTIFHTEAGYEIMWAGSKDHLSVTEDYAHHMANSQLKMEDNMVNPYAEKLRVRQG